MSKIGKKPIQFPSSVQVNIQDDWVSVKGPRGELQKKLPRGLAIVVNADKLEIKPDSKNPDKQTMANWGLYRALVRNMILGVSDGFEKTLEFNGVGYKVIPKGNDLELNLGFSHPIHYKSPGGITFKVEKNTIKITGIDKEAVGHVAAEIRAMKVPEPYKGHGIKYSDEIIKKKAGKKAVASA